LPYAGIALLWFIGVPRDHLGDREGRSFSTVLLGSGLLFLAMSFLAAPFAGGILSSYEAGVSRIIDSGVYTCGQKIMFQSLNIFAIRTAGGVHALLRDSMSVYPHDAALARLPYMRAGPSPFAGRQLQPEGDPGLSGLGLHQQRVYLAA
jgi:hypothetical protein